MPIVPFAKPAPGQRQVRTAESGLPQAGPAPDPSYLLMAAALMHSEGRLYSNSEATLDANKVTGK